MINLSSVFISYSWEQSDYADKIEAALRTIAIVKRDKNDISLWGSFSAFMKQIRKEDFVVLLISDAYLKSVNCMYEVSQLFRDEKWNDHTMYVVFDDASKIYQTKNHHEYISYWVNHRDVLEADSKKLPTQSTAAYVKELQQTLEVLNMIGEFLMLVRDANNPKPMTAVEKIKDKILTPTVSGTVHNTTLNSMKSDWTKGVFAFYKDSDAAECAARVYFSMIKKYPDSSIILPTGRSAALVFHAMVRIASEFDGCPFGAAHLISDTETFGVWNEHENSRTKRICDILINRLKPLGKSPAAEQLHLLSGVYTDSDPVKNAQKVINMFPPSVHAVSVSPLGEILAYEVDTYTDIDEIIYDAPRIVEVGEHSKKYIDPHQPSKSIISIGLGTALSASMLLILVFDIRKANILNRLFTESMTAKIPATLLRNHPNAFVLTTERIAHEAKIEDIVIGKMNSKEAAERIMAN